MLPKIHTSQLAAQAAKTGPLWKRLMVSSGKELMTDMKKLPKIASSLVGGAKAMGRQFTGFSGLGIGAFLPGAGKLLVPGMLLGIAGLGMAARGLVGESYSMANAPQGYMPGAYTPYTNAPMEFAGYRRTMLNSNADGSLLMALHNQRKG